MDNKTELVRVSFGIESYSQTALRSMMTKWMKNVEKVVGQWKSDMKEITSHKSTKAVRLIHSNCRLDKHSTGNRLQWQVSPSQSIRHNNSIAELCLSFTFVSWNVSFTFRIRHSRIYDRYWQLSLSCPVNQFLCWFDMLAKSPYSAIANWNSRWIVLFRFRAKFILNLMNEWICR